MATAEHIQQQLEALRNQVTALTQQAQNYEARLTAADTAHQQIHQELVATRAQIATASANTNQGFKLVDPKTMKPEKLGPKDGPTWKQWSEDTRAFVEALNEELASALKQVEGREDPVTEEEFSLSGIPKEHAAQMGRFLRLNTTAKSIR